MTRKFILIATLAFATWNFAYGQTDDGNSTTDYRNTMTEKQFNNMDDRNIGIFLQNNAKGTIYETFHSGEQLAVRGKLLFLSGLACSGVGLIYTVFGFADAKHGNVRCLTIGMVALCVGEGLIIASIPVRIAGGVKKKEAKEAYVNQYLKSKASLSQTTLNVDLTNGGIGLTLHF
ncbi:MAG: hypothetical protein LBR17_09255 [Bacteroidales bacterium]|jgi:hypothetical protein|nr:hypothetical protein [Bacteroidales bacterium]